MYLHIQVFAERFDRTMSKPAQTVADQIADQCVMTRWRMTSRVLTAVYDEELRPFGLKSSQLGLLVAVTKAGPVRRIDLGKYLSLDPSTLTRNLQVMLKHGWIEEAPDDIDQRGAPLQATTKGRKLLEKVAPAWQRAQAQAKKMLGSDGVNLIFAVPRTR
jgi:DNA-binding MarR family transcriptional regulator